MGYVTSLCVRVVYRVERTSDSAPDSRPEGETICSVILSPYRFSPYSIEYRCQSLDRCISVKPSTIDRSMKRNVGLLGTLQDRP